MSELKYCYNCQQVVEPDLIEISPERSFGHGEHIQAEYEERCSVCGSDELNEVAKCHSCNEWHDADSVVGHICESCRMEADEMKSNHQVRCQHCDRIIDEALYFGDHCLLCKFDVIINDINKITAAMRAAKEI